MSGDQDAIAAGPTDAEMLESAFADEQIETPEAPEPKVVEEGRQPRDESGRFAAKAQAEADAAAAKQAEGDDDKNGQVPAWRLREIREERDAVRQELDAMRRERAQWLQRQQQVREPLPERPDPINEPEAFADYLEERATAQLRADRVNLTFADLEEKMIEKGEGEVFTKAFAALERAPREVRDEVIATVNPAKAMMRWYRRDTLLSEAGDDPEGFINRKLDERLKDPEVRKRILAEAQAEARGNRSNLIHIPSVNRATGGGNVSRSGAPPSTDKDYFNDAVSGIGRR